MIDIKSIDLGKNNCLKTGCEYFNVCNGNIYFIGGDTLVGKECPDRVEEKKKNKENEKIAESWERKPVEPSFDNFDKSIYTDPLIVEKGIAFINDTSLKSLVVIGSTGVGKTFYSQSLKNHINSIVPRACGFVETVRLDEIFKKSRSFDSSEWSAIQIEKLLKFNFLVIDDLGTENMESKSNYFESGLQCFFDRFRGGLIITSNFNINQLKGNYSPRIFSRLFHRSKIIVMAPVGYSDQRSPEWLRKYIESISENNKS